MEWIDTFEDESSLINQLVPAGDARAVRAMTALVKRVKTLERELAGTHRVLAILVDSLGQRLGPDFDAQTLRHELLAAKGEHEVEIGGVKLVMDASLREG